MCKALLIAKAIYGVMVWASHDLTAKEKVTLETLNRTGLAMRVGAKRSTPTEKLETPINKEPLSLKARTAAMGRLRKLLGHD